MNKLIPFMVLVGFLSLSANNRYKLEEARREIVLNQVDSTLKFYVLLHNDQIKPKKNLLYHWYGKDKLGVNRGAFAGNLIHGDYNVYNQEGNLIKQTKFKKGVKRGWYREWHLNGELKEEVKYCKGRRQGYRKVFDAQGNMVLRQYFHNDLLYGRSIVFTDDDKKITRYKKGEMVVPKPPKPKSDSSNVK